MSAFRSPKSRLSKSNKTEQCVPLPLGFLIQDAHMRNWILKDRIPSSSSTMMHLVDYNSDSPSKTKTKDLDGEYVVKIQLHRNGPFFRKVHFFSNTFKKADIEAFMKKYNLHYLGVPACISHGTFEFQTAKYRYLVMERYSSNLQEILNGFGCPIDVKSSYTIAVALLYVLEYLHGYGYVHGNINASNIVLGKKTGTENRVYLLGMGSATKLDKDEFVDDQQLPVRVEFASREYHDAKPLSKRSDFEVLGYNLVYWLCSRLPWHHLTTQTEINISKRNFMQNIGPHLQQAFNFNIPQCLGEYLTYVNHLQYEEVPNYEYCRQIFVNGARNYGCSIDGTLCLLPNRSAVPATASAPNDDGTLVEPAPKRRRKSKPEKLPIVLDPSVVPTSAMLEILNKRNAK